MSQPCIVEQLERRLVLAVSSALLDSWFVSGQGEFAQAIIGQPGGSTTGPNTTWNGQTTPVIGDVQKISCSTTTNTVYVNTPDLASYVMGAWWGNAAQTQPFMNLPKDQNAIYKITLNTTYPQSTHGIFGGGAVALAVNGVVIYNAGDAFSYSHASGTEAGMGGDGLFNRMAEAVESVTFDAGNGHQPGNGQYHYHTNPVALRAQLGDNVDYIGTTDYFPYDPAIYLLHQGEGADGEFREHATGLHHSPIVGWMFDGYPIYGPYGYSSSLDPTSAVARMQSSYALRAITDRTTLPGWAAQLAGNKLGPAATATAADGVYVMTSVQQGQYAGPAVSGTYPLGRYGEDYAYVPGSGNLDQYGGRYCKTPEFPNGTYAYFIPIGADGSPVFPYAVNRQTYGPPNGSGKVAAITEPVTVSFNVATNVAPVVAGPAGVSLPRSGTLAFTGVNAIAISDVDAADEESIALSVTAGTLSVDLSGVLASHVTATAGASGSSTITLRGGVALLNAALATLTYTAPASGQSATLSVQANDGSAANNLSATLATTITLVNALPSATFAAISSPRTTSIDSIGITFSEAVTGFDMGDLRLTRNGGAVSLASATLTGGGTGWTLGSVSALTSADGDYELKLTASGSGITDSDGGGLAADASRSWKIDTTITVAAGQTVTDATAYAGGFQLVKRGPGTLILTAASSFAGGTRLEAGEIVVRNVAALGTGPVWVSAAATLTLDVGAVGVVVSSLSLDADGLIDLGYGRMVIAAGGIAESTLRQRLAAGYGGGAWAGGSGITSSIAAATPGRGVGYLFDGDGGTTVAFAANGDTNLDGVVDILDIANTLSSGKFDAGTEASWLDGDFNADGILDILDIGELFASELLDRGPYLPSGLSPLEAMFAGLAFEAATTGRPKKGASAAT